VHQLVNMKKAHTFIEISLYTHWPPTCFGQPCGLLHGATIQRLYTLKVYNEIIKVTETVQRCKSLHIWNRSDIYYNLILYF